jgi:hypothetical protein
MAILMVHEASGARSPRRSDYLRPNDPVTSRQLPRAWQLSGLIDGSG